MTTNKTIHHNNSPWLKELLYDREVRKLSEDTKTDVAIIGGGISGFATAFFTLKYTDKQVVMIEAGHIGHGATGHNAGQVVDYFEKFFSELVDEYGLEMAAHGQRSVSGAWDLLDLILHETGINISFSRFMGYAGCTNLEQLCLHFENKLLKKKGGLDVFPVMVADTFAETGVIPEKYADLYNVIPHSEVLEYLETEDQHFIAALQSRKGCMNSALFVEKLCNYLTKHYTERFTLFEHTKVSKIFLDKTMAILETERKLIDCKHVVLCTNGFENIEIENRFGPNIDKKFHEMVYSIVGYMAGYVEQKEKKPTAISYFANRKNPAPEDPYFYLTRRDHPISGTDKSLVCIGGPEAIKEQDQYHYSAKRKYPKAMKEKVLHFLQRTFKFLPKEFKKFDFTWHGLMGYTQSGVRCIGPEPLNPVLLYNLGCNGVGILPSIYGGKKISDHVAGKPIQKTIFDPEVQRKVQHKNSETRSPMVHREPVMI
jgi:glycine/D-amino acid oxidase-like deaminating enzyme